MEPKAGSEGEIPLTSLKEERIQSSLSELPHPPERREKIDQEGRIIDRPGFVTLGGDTSILLVPYTRTDEKGDPRTGVALYSPDTMQRIEDDTPLIIGRSNSTEPGKKKFPVNPTHKAISRTHAEITRSADGVYRIADAGSANGTTIDFLDEITPELRTYGNTEFVYGWRFIRLTPSTSVTVWSDLFGDEYTRIWRIDEELDPPSHETLVDTREQLPRLPIRGFFSMGTSSENNIVTAVNEFSPVHAVGIREGNMLLINTGDPTKTIHVMNENSEPRKTYEPTPEDILREELQLWATFYSKLQHLDELEEKFKYAVKQIGNLTFIFPDQDYYQSQLQRMAELCNQVSQLIAPGISNNRQIFITLIPNPRFLKDGINGAASSPRMIADVARAGPSADNTIAHEYAHIVLENLYSDSKIPMLAEGAATYFAERITQDPEYDMSKYKGYKEAIFLEQQRGIPEDVILSATLVVGAAKNPPESKDEEYKYSYRIGYYFAKFICDNFGQNAYLSIYKETCKPDLSDEYGNDLIKHGKIVARQRDILAEAVRRAGLELGNPNLIPENVARGFTAYFLSQNPRKNRDLTREEKNIKQGGLNILRNIFERSP